MAIDAVSFGLLRAHWTYFNKVNFKMEMNEDEHKNGTQLYGSQSMVFLNRSFFFSHI